MDSLSKNEKPEDKPINSANKGIDWSTRRTLSLKVSEGNNSRPITTRTVNGSATYIASNEKSNGHS